MNEEKPIKLNYREFENNVFQKIILQGEIVSGFYRNELLKEHGSSSWQDLKQKYNTLLLEGKTNNEFTCQGQYIKFTNLEQCRQLLTKIGTLSLTSFTLNDHKNGIAFPPKPPVLTTYTNIKNNTENEWQTIDTTKVESNLIFELTYMQESSDYAADNINLSLADTLFGPEENEKEITAPPKEQERKETDQPESSTKSAKKENGKASETATKEKKSSKKRKNKEEIEDYEKESKILKIKEEEEEKEYEVNCKGITPQELYKHVDSHTKHELERAQKVAESITCFCKGMETLKQFMTYANKLFKKLPYKLDEKNEVSAFCTGCPIHCAPKWNLSKAQGRPAAK